MANVAASVTLPGYRHLPPLAAAHGDYALRCIEAQDIEPIRQWRNAQMNVLRQAAAISPSAQRRYFASQVVPQMALARPDTILVTLLRGSERIGYGGLVHCAWPDRRAEISVLCAPDIAGDEPAYRGALLAFFAMIEGLAIDQLGFNRLTLETYDIRPFHVSVIEKAGFVREGRLREHVMIAGEPFDSLLHARIASDPAHAVQH